MELQAYLDRIGLSRVPSADEAGLKAVHYAHATSIPYENLDVQLGVPVSRAPQAAFDKIVTRKRGGWCYEMNGLLGWALEEIGFKVSRLAGAVIREFAGDEVIGNHLVLVVHLDQPWLVDAGFGDGLIEPTPLCPGAFANGILNCSLEQHQDGWWRYQNDPRGSAPSFDFNLDVRDEALLESRCEWLQTDPESNFVLNAVVQRWRDSEHLSLRGRVFQRLTADDKHVHVIEDADAYVRLLLEEFHLDTPQAASLWPKICARHEEVFANAAI